MHPTRNGSKGECDEDVGEDPEWRWRISQSECNAEYATVGLALELIEVDRTYVDAAPA